MKYLLLLLPFVVGCSSAQVKKDVDAHLEYHRVSLDHMNERMDSMERSYRTMNGQRKAEFKGTNERLNELELFNKAHRARWPQYE